MLWLKNTGSTVHEFMVGKESSHRSCKAGRS